MINWKKLCSGLLAAAMVMTSVPGGLLAEPVEVEAAVHTVAVPSAKYEMSFENNLEIGGTGTQKPEVTLRVDSEPSQDSIPEVYQGGATFSEGKFGKALDLRDSEGKGYGAWMKGVSVDATYTVSLWVNSREAVPNTNPICFLTSSMFDVNNWMSFSGSPDGGELQVWVNGRDVPKISYSQNTWNQYTIAVDGAKFAVYKDGELISADQNGRELVQDNLMDIFLGVNYWDRTPNCMIDELKIYDETLTVEQVEALYKNVEITTKDVLIRVGETFELDAGVLGGSEGYNLSWSSSQEEVATVSPEGVITGRTKGTADITATLSYGDQVIGTDTVSVTVKGEQGELIADFSFDDEVNGFQGAGAIATPSGNVTIATDGDRKYLDMSAGNLNLNVTKEGTEKSPLVGCNEMTVSYDVKPSGDENHNMRWLFYASNSNNPEANGLIGIKDWPNGWIDVYRTENSWCNGYIGPTDQWQHVDVVFAEEGTYIYANKSLVNKYPNFNADLTTFLTEDSKLWIGSSDWDTNLYFKGLLDNYKIYNYALTANEIASEPISEISVTAAGDATVVETGSTLQLTANITPTEAKYQDIVWTTSNDAVATVDVAGLVTPVAPGEVTITATTRDKEGEKSASINLTVKKSLDEIKAEAIEELKAYKNVADYRAEEQMTLENSIAGGTAAINKATTEAEVAEALATAKGVIDVIPTDLQKTREDFNSAKTAATAIIKDYNVDVEYLEEQLDTYYTIQDEALTALDEIKVTETATLEEMKQAIADIEQLVANTKASIDALPTAEDLTVTGVSITQGAEMTMTVDDTATLEAVVEAGAEADKTVDWSSSNPAVATVAADGTVTAIATGTADITAKVKVNPDMLDEYVEATIKITVEAKKYTVSISNNGTVEEVGKYEALSLAKVTAPEAPANQKFAYWKTDKNKIVCYAPNYSFYVMEDVTLTPVYVEDEATVEEQVTILCTASYNKSTKKVAFTSKRSLPEGCTIVGHGIVITDSKGWTGLGSDPSKLVLGATRTKRAVATTTGRQGTYVARQVCSESDTWYGKAYVTYTDKNGKTNTVYSDYVSCEAVVAK